MISDNRNLNRQDFIFTNNSKQVTDTSKGPDFIIKNAGTINGQQFIVEDCNYCGVFILDYLETLTVDNSTNIKLICGPCNGSVFLRDCTDCDFVITCQQLRLRNCKNCRIFLFSTTRPIIESSNDIGFKCSDLNYFGIDDHFNKTSLDYWGNKWFNVFDFTPDGEGSRHYYFLPHECNYFDIFNEFIGETNRLRLQDSGNQLLSNTTMAKPFFLPIAGIGNIPDSVYVSSSSKLNFASSSTSNLLPTLIAIIVPDDDAMTKALMSCLEEVISRNGNKVLRTAHNSALPKEKITQLIGSSNLKSWKSKKDNKTPVGIIFAEVLIYVDCDFTDFKESVFVNKSLIKSDGIRRFVCYFGIEARDKSKLVFDSWSTAS